MKTLFVSNLHPEATLEVVRQKFATVGPLKDVKRIKDYAFVEYEQREHALKAIELFHGTSRLSSSTSHYKVLTFCIPLINATKSAAYMTRVLYVC